MIPIIIVFGLVSVLAGSRLGSKTKTKAISSGNMSETYSPRPSKDSAPHIAALAVLLKRGDDPPEWLINEAMCEAYDRGNYKLVKEIRDLFADDEDDEDDGSKPEDEPQTLTVSGKSSPIDGVPNERWEEFVSRLSTDDPAFSTDKHVGRYHHSRDRLAQLGIDKIDTEDDQYQALVTDLEDARNQCSRLIADHLAQCVMIDGNEVVITQSGLLGLLKAAGVKHARSWLEHPDDRSKFPQTTKIFLATNGVF